MQDIIAIFLGLVFDDQRVDSHMCHVQTRSPTRVGFFDATRQRRFPSNRNSICGGKHMSHQKTWSEDQFISRPEWIAFRVHFIKQNTREKSTPTEVLP